MKIVDISGKKWVVELGWEILPGQKTIELEKKEVAVKNKSVYGVVAYNGLNDSLVSGSSGYAAIGLAKKSFKNPSAALCLSMANNQFNSNRGGDDTVNWIVIEELKDGQYWVGAIQGGIPSPEFDFVADLTTVVTKVNEQLKDVDDFVIYSVSQNVIDLYDGLKDISKVGLLELVKDQIEKKVKVQKLTGIPNNVMYAALALFVAGAGFYGYTVVQESALVKQQMLEYQRKEAAEAEFKRQVYESELLRWEQEYSEAKSQKIDSIVSSILKNPNALISTIYKTVGDVTYDINGWEKNKITCHVNILSEQKVICDMFFERTGLATNRMLLQSYSDANIDGDNAIISREIIFEDQNIFNAQNADVVKSLPNSRNWGANIISQLQLLKLVDIDHEIAGSNELYFTAPAKPLSPQEIADGVAPNIEMPESVGVSSGEILVSGNSLYMLNQVASNVDFKFISLNSIDLNLENGYKGDINWVLNLSYYINSDSGKQSDSNSSLEATVVIKGAAEGGSSELNVDSGKSR